MDDALFTLHKDWAEGIARTISRTLPPSLDIADLMQTAVIEHWRRVESYDSSRGVPYRSYAYPGIHGAVLMASRRKNYREATHEELSLRHVDDKGRPDVILLAKECRRNRDEPRERRRRVRIQAALKRMDSRDAYLIKRVYFDGIEVGGLAGAWQWDAKAMAKLVSGAVRRLRREARE